MAVFRAFTAIDLYERWLWLGYLRAITNENIAISAVIGPFPLLDGAFAQRSN